MKNAATVVQTMAAFFKCGMRSLPLGMGTVKDTWDTPSRT